MTELDIMPQLAFRGIGEDADNDGDGADNPIRSAPAEIEDDDLGLEDEYGGELDEEDGLDDFGAEEEGV